VLVNWGAASEEHRRGQFRREWIQFCKDPEAVLPGAGTAVELLATLHTEACEARTAAHVRGGVAVIDEMIAGPLPTATTSNTDEQQQQQQQRAALATAAASAIAAASAAAASAEQQEAAARARAVQRKKERAAAVSAAMNGPPEDAAAQLPICLHTYLQQPRHLSAAAALTPSAHRRPATSCGTSRASNVSNSSGCLRQRHRGLSSAGSFSDAPIREAAADSFGRPLTRSGRRRHDVAHAVASDGRHEAPDRRPATASALLVSRAQNACSGSSSSSGAGGGSSGKARHYFYDARLVTPGWCTVLCSLAKLCCYNQHVCGDVLEVLLRHTGYFLHTGVTLL
jgi:hypothetical protein